MSAPFRRSITLALTACALALPGTAAAKPVVVTGAGDLTTALTSFRALLGNPNNVGARGQQASGRREINWDGVPAQFTNTNNFPGDFFNTTAVRGTVFSTPGTGLRISDNNFADVNPTYAAQFTFFSPVKTFAAVGSNIIDVEFRVAGTNTPAAVNGFGVVFSDVDVAESTSLEFFQGTRSLGRFFAPVRAAGTSGLSFLGVHFDAGERVSRVRITHGQAALGANVNDVSAGGTQDLVITDDFLLSEPILDSDGDGVADVQDDCLPSDRRSLVDVNGAAPGQTSITNTVNARGCTIQDLVNARRDAARNSQEFVASILALAEELRAAGVITAAQARELVIGARAVRRNRRPSLF